MALPLESTQAALVSELESTLYNLAKLIIQGDRYRLYLSDGYVPEVVAALKVLAYIHGVQNWRDVL